MDWQKQIADAQLLATYELEGTEYVRIPYGEETEEAAAAGAQRDPCRDCAVSLGMFHVPGCAVERCPLCRGQAISCACGS